METFLAWPLGKGPFPAVLFLHTCGAVDHQHMRYWLEETLAHGYAAFVLDSWSQRGLPNGSCYGSCAKAWPPYIVSHKPRAGAGVRAGLIGTTRRKDGKLQVTYGGHPLYFYSGDPKGQAKCQKVTNSGGIWLVVAANGKAVR